MTAKLLLLVWGAVFAILLTPILCQDCNHGTTKEQFIAYVKCISTPRYGKRGYSPLFAKLQPDYYNEQKLARIYYQQLYDSLQNADN